MDQYSAIKFYIDTYELNKELFLTDPNILREWWSIKKTIKHKP